MSENRSEHLASEFVLALCTAAVALSIADLMVGPDVTTVLVLSATGTHLGSSLFRRAGLGIGTAAAVILAAGAVAMTAYHYGDAGALGGVLPTPTVFEQVRIDLSDGWTVFDKQVAPVDAVPGLILISALGISLAAILADWAAFRVGSAHEALVPGATLFVVSAVLDRAELADRLPAATLAVGTALLFLLLHRHSVGVDPVAWVGEGHVSKAPVLAAGAIAALAVSGLAALVTPRLPWTDEPAVLAWNETGGDPPRRVTSPLLDIRKDLVDLSEEEVFQVRTSTPDYLRVAALSDYEGTVWNIPKLEFVEADGDLPAPAGGLIDGGSTETFEVSELAEGQEWLPLVNQPRRIESEQLDALYNPDLASMIIREGVESAGLAYTIQAQVPAPDPAALASARISDDAALIAEMTALPDGVPGIAVQLAREVTSGATSPFESVRALQDWFRTDFEYSTDVAYSAGVPSDHDTSAIEEFLESRVGYCEQFAGTFAVMARSLGIPTRVVVGYTQGEQIGEDLYSVRGIYAHAWAEVHFDGIGWVLFDPTPGRGSASAQEWTGVSPAQVDPDNINDSEEPSAPTTTIEPSSTTVPADPVPTTLAPQVPAAAPAPAAPGGSSGSDGALSSALLWLLAAALAAGAYVSATVGLPRRRATLRRRAADTPRSIVALSWDEALGELDAVGLSPHGSETAPEFGERIGLEVPALAAPMHRLALGKTAAAFGGSVDETTVGPVTAARDSVAAHVEERLGRKGRLARMLHPRNLTAAISPLRSP